MGLGASPLEPLLRLTPEDADVEVQFQPGRSGHFGWEQATGADAPTLSLTDNIRLYEHVANAVAPSRVAAVALNTSLLSEDEARAEIERVAAETGLPTDDPYRFGPERLFAGLRASLEGVAR